MMMTDELPSLTHCDNEIDATARRISKISIASIADGSPSPECTTRMMARMIEASPFRRRLGMKFREHILGHFSMERYLNEHHETLWIAEAVYLNEIAGRGAVQAKAQLLFRQASVYKTDATSSTQSKSQRTSASILKSFEMIESIGDESKRRIKLVQKRLAKLASKADAEGNHNIANRRKVEKLKTEMQRSISTMAQRVEELQKMMDELADVELDVEKRWTAAGGRAEELKVHWRQSRMGLRMMTMMRGMKRRVRGREGRGK